MKSISKNPVNDLLEDYARFIESTPDHVVNCVLKKLLSRDLEYRKWRTPHRGAHTNPQTMRGAFRKPHDSAHLELEESPCLRARRGHGAGPTYKGAFPEGNLFLELMFLRDRRVFLGFKHFYIIFLYTTPHIADSILLSGRLHVDLDHDGQKSLDSIQQSDLVPLPSYVLSTSPGRFQALWKVEGIVPGRAEALLDALAREFNGDPAATDSTRAVCLPGFANKKYDEDFRAVVRSHTDRTTKHGISCLGPNRWSPSRERAAGSEPTELSQSERDWAYAKPALARGDNLRGL